MLVAGEVIKQRHVPVAVVDNWFTHTMLGMHRVTNPHPDWEVSGDPDAVERDEETCEPSRKPPSSTGRIPRTDTPRGSPTSWRPSTIGTRYQRPTHRPRTRRPLSVRLGQWWHRYVSGDAVRAGGESVRYR